VTGALEINRGITSHFVLLKNPWIFSPHLALIFLLPKEGGSKCSFLLHTPALPPSLLGTLSRNRTEYFTRLVKGQQLFAVLNLVQNSLIF
jgi:hypothetical protein